VTDRRRVFLIRLALALAALRFAVYPWLEHQLERRDQLSVLTDRLDRAQGVIENRNVIETTAKDLSKQSQLTAPRFAYAETADRFRLDTQRRVTEVIRSNGLGVSLFDWLVEGNSEAAQYERDGFSFARMRVEFAGPLRQVATAQSDLEGSFPNLIVRRVALNFRDITTNIDSGLVTASIIADVYYKLGSSPTKSPVEKQDSNPMDDEPKPIPREAPGFSTVAPGPLPAPLPRVTPQAIPGDIPPGTIPLPRPPPKGLPPKMIPKGIAPPLGDDEEAV
jgi:hypothetical protein